MGAARHRIHIDLEVDGAMPYGSATVVGGEGRTFAGWVGLVAAVDDLVRDDHEPEREELRG